MDRIKTEITTCDACGTKAECAKLGPDGFYTLALCGKCHPPLEDQQRRDLLCEYSDLYKDLYGIRPNLVLYGEGEIEDLQAAVTSLAEDLRKEIEREQQEAEEHRIEEHPTSGVGWALVIEV